MSNNTETNFILVKRSRTQHEDGTTSTTIAQVVRSYLSQRRAFQDLELLQEAEPQAIYDVFDVAHIDD